MYIISSADLATFFREAPLYSKVKFLEQYPINSELRLPDEIYEKVAFKFFCPIESEVHTFKLEKSKATNSIYVFRIETLNAYLNPKNKIDISFHLNGICQSCNYGAEFLINFFSEEVVIEKDLVWPTLYLRKFGQYPPIDRMPESEVYSYLTDEDKENYKKALANLGVSYGIGAYAYFRRIIENEIKRIVEDISKLEFEGVDNVRKAWKEYEQNHQMTSLIDNIYQYLPKSLKEVTGDNPIKLLHQQLSGGIHEFSEEQCLQKAKQVDVLLRYVIRKVNSERFELKELKEAIKGLRGQ